MKTQNNILERPKIYTLDDIDSIFNFHRNEKENKHQIFAEECFVPKANCLDPQRGNMWASHVKQIVHLIRNEFPRVFTRLENQIGKFSVAYLKADEQATILARIKKNEYEELLVIEFADGLRHAIMIQHGVNISESYGYAIENCLGDRQEGDTIEKDEYIFKSSNYDDQGNYGIGMNLNADYVPWGGLTYEDGVVITESGAAKLTSYNVDKVTIGVNGNEFGVNLYGDHSIPRIGETIYNDKVIISLRREESQNILYNFQSGKMDKIEPGDTTYFCDGGKVVGIHISSNLPLEKMKMRKNEFSKEVVELYEDELNFYKQVVSVLNETIPPYTKNEYAATLSPEEFKSFDEEMKTYKHYYVRGLPREKNPIKYTDDLAYIWKYAHQYIDEEIKWRSKTVFENFKIEFTILKENKLCIGSKVTGRFGNKGVIAKIIPDEQAPYCAEHNIRAEVILNPLGIMNRQNIAQSYEQMINFIADHVYKEIKEYQEDGNYMDAMDSYMDYISGVAPEQYDFIMEEVFMKNVSVRKDFIDDIVENGIYTCVPPFHDNVAFTDFVNVFNNKPHWMTKYKCEGIELPQVIGALYMVRLKHEPKNKNSIRSAGGLNVKRQPYKSKEKKNNRSLFNDNPVRSGDMETLNLMIAKRPDLIARIYRAYSTCEEMRESFITELLTNKNPMDISIVDTGDISIPRKVLDKYLEVLGYRLID